jgi:hypothetical protein
MFKSEAESTVVFPVEYVNALPVTYIHPIVCVPVPPTNVPLEVNLRVYAGFIVTTPLPKEHVDALQFNKLDMPEISVRPATVSPADVVPSHVVKLPALMVRLLAQVRAKEYVR